ncbi:MAG: hypothetical protein AB1608_09250 [Thermoproteota archaeon]
MKISTTTLVLGIALTVVAGLFSSTIFGLVGTKADVQTSPSAAAIMTGHVETIVRDSLGNVKEYRQSDNIIVNDGENCVLKMLFGADGGDSIGSGTNTCTGEINSGFRVIAIGNSSVPAGNSNSTLIAEYTAANGNAALARQLATTITLTNSTSATGISQATALLEATFTNGGSNGQTVNESGLFNSTDTNTDGMFARQQFTGVSLNNGDSLTVRWTVNIGGTSTIDQSTSG